MELTTLGRKPAPGNPLASKVERERLGICAPTQGSRAATRSKGASAAGARSLAR